MGRWKVSPQKLGKSCQVVYASGVSTQWLRQRTFEDPPNSERESMTVISKVQAERRTRDNVGAQTGGRMGNCEAEVKDLRLPRLTNGSKP